MIASGVGAHEEECQQELSREMLEPGTENPRGIPSLSAPWSRQHRFSGNASAAALLKRMGAGLQLFHGVVQENLSSRESRKQPEGT